MVASVIVPLDVALCAVFWVDFGWRLAKSRPRGAFFRRNWVDLVGAIPLIEPLRATRLVRFARILRLLRVGALVRRIMVRYDLRVPSPLPQLSVLSVVVWLAAASGFYFFEAGQNEAVESYDDALWWSITTISTVGYGDKFPVTSGGRFVAVAAMIFGVGALGTLAGALATTFADARQRTKSGRRSYVMKDHVLVLGWNGHGPEVVRQLLHDSRYAEAMILIVAELDACPLDDPRVRFVHGSPALRNVLERAAVSDAAVAIVLARDGVPETRDMESAIVVHVVRRLNPDAHVTVELVDPARRELLVDAGADAVVSPWAVASALIARSALDEGSLELVTELLTADEGSDLYRVHIPEGYVGKPFREFAIAMLDQEVSVVAVTEAGKIQTGPSPSLVLPPPPPAFVLAPAPPP